MVALDIVPTLMTLVGGKIDANETLHGIDLSKTVILNKKVSCIAFHMICKIMMQFLVKAATFYLLFTVTKPEFRWHYGTKI